MTDHELLTPVQVAEMLTISKKTLQEFIKAGEIAFIPIGRGEKRLRKGFDRKDILDFIERRRKRQCPSTNTPKAPIINMTSSSTVIGFTARLEQKAREKRLNSKPTPATKQKKI